MKTDSPHIWPAEWERQAAMWIAWPHNRETWPGRFTPVPQAFVRFIERVATVQPVHVLAGPTGSNPSAMDLVGDIPQVTIHQVATNDCWIRDFGPTFVKTISDETLVGIDWHYNAWGGKYPPYEADAKAAEEICKILKIPRSVSSIYCEGGALENNGQGTLLTTSSCLLSKARNPGWSREMVEAELQRQLGIHKCVWVDGGGLQGDDTDGHIDQLARFVAPDTVVAAISSDSSDPNRHGLEQNIRLLRSEQNANGEQLTVYPLPTPPPRFIGESRVPESYCNFVFANDCCIVPTFRHEATDSQAIDLLEQLLPTRKIIPLDAYDLVWGLGAFHCASQHQPEAEISFVTQRVNRVQTTGTPSGVVTEADTDQGRKG